MAAVEGAPAEAPFNRLLLENAFEKASGQMGKLCTNVDACKDNFCDAATTFGYGHQDKIDQLKAEVRKLIQLRAEAEAFQRAVQKVKAEYQPTGEPTNFKALLKQHCDADELLSSSLQVQDSHPWLKQVDEELGAGTAAAPQELGSDDDLQMEATDFLNHTCPLTMKPLLEIQEPVEDQMGYVYEKAAIHHHIQRCAASGQRPECPVSGTRHLITAANLLPSRKVQRAQRRARLGLGTQLGLTQQPHNRADEVVLDADS